ncbi:MAG: BPL-N domain-containing protein [Parachlamydiales bacterium]
MKVVVYKGEGVAPFSLRQTLSSLKGALPDADLAPIDAEALAEGSWAAGTTLLAFPGGRDLPYHNTLQGKANRQIRCFVEEGGLYLGLCAGAYYASSRVVFERGRPLEVIGDRELAFFPGETHGPLFEKSFTYTSEGSAESARIAFGMGELHCYYNGGCTFPEAERHPNTEILARYADLPGGPAAIIRCQVGKGRALLSGVHLEHAYSARKRRPLPPTLFPHFEASEERRRALFNRLIQELVSPPLL